MSLKWLINFVNSVQLTIGNLVKCQPILSDRSEDKKLKCKYAFLMNVFSYMEWRYIFSSDHKGSALSVILLLGQVFYYMAVLHLKITEIINLVTVWQLRSFVYLPHCWFPSCYAWLIEMILIQTKLKKKLSKCFRYICFNKFCKKFCITVFGLNHRHLTITDKSLNWPQ